MKRLQEFINDSNFSKKTKYMKTRYLIFCFDYFRSIHTSENFLEIKSKEFLSLFKQIDSMDLTEDAKRHYRYALKNYADFYKKEILADNDDDDIKLKDYDFIFSNRFFRFRNMGSKEDINYLEKEELFELLEWAKKTQPPKIYFGICVIATTGCHVEGLISLTKDRVDFENRKFIMHDKALAFGSNVKNYIINNGLIEPLRKYIDSMFEDEMILFDISAQKFNKRLNRWNIWMHSRIFRDTINSVWEDMDVEESIRDILCNRIPKSVNAKHYLKKYGIWKKRVEKYDKIDFFLDFNFF